MTSEGGPARAPAVSDRPEVYPRQRTSPAGIVQVSVLMMRFALAILFLFIAVPSASAQVNTLQADNPRDEVSLKVGPFYVSPLFELTEFGVDSNVFNTPIVQLRDFTFTVRPSASIWLPVARRGLVKANVGADFVWYQRFESERSIDPLFTVRGEAYLRRFTVFAENAFSNTKQRTGDNFEIDVRSRVLSNTLRAGVDMRLTPKTTLEVHGRWSELDYDADSSFLGGTLAETLNRTTTGFGAVARYRPTVLTTFELLAERFEERFTLSPERDGDNVRVMPGVAFAPRALINGHARVGIRHLNPVDETVLPEFKGLVSDFGLSYTLFGSTTVGLTHTRDVLYSYELTQPYYVDSGIGARVRRALGRTFDVVLSADRHALAYEDLVGEGASLTPQRVDTVWNYGGSVGYRVGRDGRIGFGVTYWTRDSTTNTSRQYNGFRLGTTASYGF